MSWLRNLKEPQILVRFHRGSKWLWVVAIPVTEGTSLRGALPWLLFMSLWANVVTHWSAERALEAQLEREKEHAKKESERQAA